MKHLPLLLSFIALTAFATEPAEKTIRICDDTGCADRPMNYSSPSALNAVPPNSPQMVALEQAADKDPRAAYDLGLRYFRGDGIRQDSYQAIEWMRRAGEGGDLRAQLALGRFYLMGLEEMGSDPAEAEKWLGMAAAKGSGEAKKLLKAAQAAKSKDQEKYQQWIDDQRGIWQNDWRRGYSYRSTWRHDTWYYEDAPYPPRRDRRPHHHR